MSKPVRIEISASFSAILFALALSLAVLAAPSTSFAMEGQMPDGSLDASNPPSSTSALSVATIDKASDETLATPYCQMDFATLYKAGLIKVTADAEISTPESGGLLISGTVKQLKDAYLFFQEPFAFDKDKPVGRVSIIGSTATEPKVTIGVYLDGAKTPFARIQLENPESGDGIWLPHSTADAYGTVTAGKRVIDLDLEIEAESDEQRVDVLLETIEFAQMTLPVMYFTPDEGVNAGDTGDAAGNDGAVNDGDDDSGNEGIGEDADDTGKYGTVQDMNNSENHDIWCKGSFDIRVPDGYVNEFGGAEQQDYVNLPVEIRGRGNSTWMNEGKKPYRFKLGSKTDLFGMGKNKHWVLLANVFDETLARNRLTFWLGRQLGLAYTPKCVPVELVVDGDYYGSYLLCEQVRVDKNRIDVANPEDNKPEDSGYLISVAQLGKDPKDLFRTTHRFDLLNVTPATEDEDDIPNVGEYIDFIREYVQKTENALFGAGFKDANGTSYTEYLDIDSAVKYWWVQEFSKNGDAFDTGSTYLYKEGNGKLYWGPLWDFDLAWGYSDETPPAETMDADFLFYFTKTPWFDQLKGNARFRAKIIDCWEDELKGALAEATADGGLLDSYYEQTVVSWLYDKERWPIEVDEAGYESPHGSGSPDDDASGGNGSLGIDDPDGEQPPASEDAPSMRLKIDQLRNWIDAVSQGVDANIDAFNGYAHAVTFIVDGVAFERHFIPPDQNLTTAIKPPEKDGYITLGWYKEDGEQYRPTEDMVTNDMQVTARYIKESEAIKAEDLFLWNYNVTVDLAAGGYQARFTVTPFDAQDRRITWTSSDEDVATVDENGLAAFVSTGTATITGTLPNGKSKSYTLTVTPRIDDMLFPEALVPDQETLDVSIGEYAQIRIRPVPEAALTELVAFESSNPEVVIVDKNGIVQGLADGVATITAEDMYTKARATVQVVVGKGAVEPSNHDADPGSLDGQGSAKTPSKFNVKGKTVKLKATKLKKRAIKLKASKAFDMSGKATAGKIAFKKVKGNAKIKVSKKGKVTVKKGLKRGKYKVKVKVTASGTPSYQPKTTTVTVKIRVK